MTPRVAVMGCKSFAVVLSVRRWTHSRHAPSMSPSYRRIRYDSSADGAPSPTVITASTLEDAVPPAPEPTDEQIMQLADWIHSHRGRILVLSGAGLSTESGIPDYRTSEMQRKVINPIKHHEFVGNANARQRYWARSAIGYERLTPKQPHNGHQCLADLTQNGFLMDQQITQNVDGLLQRVGCNALELHGSIHSCTCLECGTTVQRGDFQQYLRDANPHWEGFSTDTAGSSRPDGDTELADDVIKKFLVVNCRACGGMIKPDVVFFGGKVPDEVATSATRLVDESRAILVVGSSVATWSAFRLVRQAHESGRPVVAVTFGQTRADELWALKLNTLLGSTLRRVRDTLVGSSQ